MKNFEFKSQVATSIEQSKRLLELGLKKETADMYLTNMSKKGIAYTDNWQIGSIPYKDVMSFWEERGLQLEETSWEIIPAWSLHRLVEMINLKIQFRLKEKTTVLYGVSHSQPFQSFSGFGIDSKSYYNSIINAIEWLIKEGYFNKDYLEEKL